MPPYSTPAPKPDTRPARTGHADDRWTARLLQRIRTHLLLKVTAISAYMWVFFIGYFHVLRNPVRPVAEMPLTALDHAITPQPLALAAYVSLWFYVGVAPGLMLRLRELVLFGCWATALCAAGLLSFLIWPTAIPAGYGAALAHYPGFGLLHGVDAAGNACPSLHVATALFSAMWIQRLLGSIGAPPAMTALNWCWLVLIAYSTMAVRQHVALDVAAGAALGALFGWASLRFYPGGGR